MNALQQLHKIIDESNWDVTDVDNINHAFQQVNDQLSVEKDEKLLHLSELERQAFAFNKSPEKKLSFKVAGDQTLDDGTKQPFEWPDVKTFTSEDFAYLNQRFHESANLFAKSEYGLVLYYGDQLKQNEDIFILAEGLFKLAQNYIDHLKSDADKYYILYVRTVLNNAIYIAEKRKSEKSINELYKKIIRFVFEVHQNWDESNKAGLRIAIDFTDFAIQFYKDFKEIVNVPAIIEKNWRYAKYLTQTHAWGAIYITDISIKLAKKIDSPLNNLLNFKAAQYEQLAENSEKQNNMASVSFIEKAMNIYKGLKDEENLKRLQIVYQKLRTDFRLGEVRQEMPQEETQRIIQHIRAVIRDSSEEDIVKTLLLTPMVMPLSQIKDWSQESFKQTLLQNLLPVSIQDKFGNTIATYTSDDERKKFSLLRTYEFHLQIATQTLQQFFIEALKAKKISAESVIGFLKNTWLGQPTTRVSNGREIEISYLALFESGIISFFNELQLWQTVSGYIPNFVSATDSLVLKTEYIIREFTNNIGLPTFKPKARDANLIMEKTLDDLLNDLDGKLTEDDHFFIKFILTEKAGYNLRNRIAHGLMDNIDYGLEYPVLALVNILKLSNYQFTNQLINHNE